MDNEQVVIDSANAAIETVGTEPFFKLTKNLLGMTGSQLAKQVDPEDGPGLFAPLELEDDGKDRLGAILALDDRAIIAWTVGTFRMKNFEAVVSYDSIASVEFTTRKGGAISKDREGLRIVAERTWNLVFGAVFEGGNSIRPFIGGMLSGAMKPVFELSE